MAEALTLFEPEDLIEWVVEVDEIFLNSIGAQDRAVMEWWAIHSGRPGIAARTIHLFIAPPGALLYVKCADREEAEWLAGVLVGKGMHAKGVTVRQLGRPIRCTWCGERRPFWATTRRFGRRCRPCWDEHMRLPWPGGVDVVCVDNDPPGSVASPKATPPLVDGPPVAGRTDTGNTPVQPEVTAPYVVDANNGARSPCVNTAPG